MIEDKDITISYEHFEDSRVKMCASFLYGGKEYGNYTVIDGIYQNGQLIIPKYSVSISELQKVLKQSVREIYDNLKEKTI